MLLIFILLDIQPGAARNKGKKSAANPNCQFFKKLLFFKKRAGYCS